MVYHDHDRVEPPGWRELSDQINRQEGKGNGGSGGNRDEGWCDWVSIGFHLLTKGTTFNIFVNIRTQAWPPEVTFDKFFCFKVTGLSGSQMVMGHAVGETLA
jgi:hypothetical protein